MTFFVSLLKEKYYHIPYQLKVLASFTSSYYSLLCIVCVHYVVKSQITEDNILPSLLVQTLFQEYVTSNYERKTHQ